jgi:hypothetical protein
MLLNDSVSFTPVDDASFDVTLSDAGNRVTGRLFVGTDGRLVDFSTTDRWYAGPDGLVHARWTTPIDGWITNGERRLPSRGRAVWHLETGEFEYAWGRFRARDRRVQRPTHDACPITRAPSKREMMRMRTRDEDVAELHSQANGRSSSSPNAALRAGTP